MKKQILRFSCGNQQQKVKILLPSLFSRKLTTGSCLIFNNNIQRNKTIAKEYPPIDMSWNIKKKSNLSHTYLDLEQSKVAMNELTNLFKNDENIKKEITEIAKMSNESELYDKFIRYLNLMNNTRKLVMTKFAEVFNESEDLNDRRLRMSIGRNSGKDEELLNSVKDLNLYLIQNIFQIDNLETKLKDIRILQVYQQAQEAMYEHFGNEMLLGNLDNNQQEKVLPMTRLWLFNKERELIAEFAKRIAKEEIRQKQLDNNELSEEEKQKPYGKWIEEITLPDNYDTLESPKEWIIYRFVLNDILFRLG
ncbi:hypothetical protein ABK040_005958 [Willaertia magna]